MVGRYAVKRMRDIGLNTYAGAPYGLGRHIQALSVYDLHMYMLVSY